LDNWIGQTRLAERDSVPASFPRREENGGKFREETSTVQPERSGGRLLVLGIFRHFLVSGIKPAAFLFGSVSLSAVRKRNEHVQ
jgi:hypothetical protein